MMTVESSKNLATAETRSAGSPAVAVALCAHPCGGIVVPGVAVAVGQCPDARFDVVPSAFVIEAAADQLGDERTSAATPATAVELVEELVVELYVHSHVRRLAH